MSTDNPTAQKLLEAFTQFRRLHRRMNPVDGLTHSEIMVLFAVNKACRHEKAGVKVSDISSIMRVAPPTITQAVSNLEADGYVERNMDKNDRRAVRVCMTEKGGKILDKARKAFTDSLIGLIEYLGEDRCNELADLLTEVYKYFSDVRDAET